VLWRDTRLLTREAGAPLPVEVDPPADAPGTELLAPEPTYWELALVCELPGADFAATDLLPVYGPGRGGR
jgi:hypothetical protein